jgi:uncharacterized phage-associated protein
MMNLGAATPGIKPAEGQASQDARTAAASPAVAPNRLSLHKGRAIEAIDFLAMQQPGITQYYVCKTLFFADRQHLRDHGSLITGDRYLALAHGPVPARIYDLLMPDSIEEPGWLALFHSRVSVSTDGTAVQFYSRGKDHFPNLARTHREYLWRIAREIRALSFWGVADLAHQDEAWKIAWALPDDDNQMDLSYWVAGDDPRRERTVEALKAAGLSRDGWTDFPSGR